MNKEFDINQVISAKRAEELENFENKIKEQMPAYKQFIKSQNEKTTSGEYDVVKKPAHYNRSSIETIEVLEAYSFLSFGLLNAMKYIMRCEDKGVKVQDLKKAIWYIEREISKS